MRFKTQALFFVITPYMSKSFGCMRASVCPCTARHGYTLELRLKNHHERYGEDGHGNHDLEKGKTFDAGITVRSNGHILLHMRFLPQGRRLFQQGSIGGSMGSPKSNTTD